MSNIGDALLEAIYQYCQDRREQDDRVPEPDPDPDYYDDEKEIDTSEVTEMLDQWLTKRLASLGFIGPKLAEAIAADRPDGQPVKTDMPTIGDVVFWYPYQGGLRTGLRTARVTGSYKTPGGLEHVMTDFKLAHDEAPYPEIPTDIEARLAELKEEQARLQSLIDRARQR